MSNRPRINTVFTPRASEVNSSMYIDRPDLERLLTQALQRNTHVLIHGESGSGKSWLYKKVLDENRIPYVVANSGNASRLSSVTEEISNAIVEPGFARQSSITEEKNAEISAGFAKGGGKHTKTFEYSKDEPLLEAFKRFADRHKGKKVVVLDNLESIIDEDDLMKELADIILLLDDKRYSECNVVLLVVGVPNDVMRFFRETKNADSVANRLYELDRVTGLNENGVAELVNRGFEQLNIKISSEQRKRVTDYVFWVTLGIPQSVHEYCECLALNIESTDWKFDEIHLEKSNSDWLRGGMRYCYQAVENNLNRRDSGIARKNQVIYSIGRYGLFQISSSNIDTSIKKLFPHTVPKTSMGLGAVLTELSEGDTPLLIKNENNGTFSVKDPKFSMAIRMMLSIDSDTQKIKKKKFTM